MSRLNLTPFAEAAASPKAVALWPGMVMRPFHLPIAGMPDLFHIYCERHPDFGFCGEEGEARDEALKHSGKPGHERLDSQP